MATSITQAKPLLTATELELFDHSRSEPIKAFTAKQVAGKEKRARTLRDKYRDLYRRQTVANRGKSGAGRGSKASLGSDAAGEANARTQRKAEIMGEVLERFEARSTLLESRAQREAGNKPGTANATRGARPAAGKSAVAAKKSATKTKDVAPVKKARAPKKVATKATARTPAKAPAKTPAKAASVKASESHTAAQPSGRSAAKSTAKTASSRKPSQTEAPLSAVGHLEDGATGAVHVEHLTGQDPTERSHKAPSEMAPTYGGKAQAPDLNAPLDMVPAAERGNPVRNMPGNIAIQGHVSSSIRRAQGKKDSR